MTDVNGIGTYYETKADNRRHHNRDVHHESHVIGTDWVLDG